MDAFGVCGNHCSVVDVTSYIAFPLMAVAHDKPSLPEISVSAVAMLPSAL